MARTIPTYSVDVAWSGQQTGVFILGTSVLDGPDVLAGSFGQNVFDSITSDVKAIRITRGRQGDLGALEQGRCVLVLKDATGKYNPENASSALAGYLDTHKPLRVRATHLGTTYGLFYGFISRIQHAPERSAQESVIEAVDLYEWLNAAKPTIASTGATTVGTAIGLILTAIEWSDPTLRDLDTGKAIADFSADGSKSALQLIQDLIQIDLGLFFVDGDGVATFVEGESRWVRRAVDDTLTQSIISRARPSVDKQAIINMQVVTRQGGVAQLAEANDGKPFYYGTPITSAYLTSDSAAKSLASMIVALRKHGRPPTRELVLLDTDDTSIAKQLSRELGDRVAFSESVGGTSVEGTIEGLAHEIRPGGFHRASYLLSKRPFDAFTLDQSVLDGSDVLAY